MIYKIIATGSTGNAVIINSHILIDCGVSLKALKDDYKQLQLVLLTHIHGDHFKPSTISRLAAERPTLRFGCCKWLVQPLLDCNVSARNIDVYEIGKIYDYRAFQVSPVQLYHDVSQCGYRIFQGGKKAIYCTDTNTLQGISAKDYDLYMIEANYEDDEIQERIREKQEQGLFCYEKRVLDSHLSKEQADAFLLENMSDSSEYVYLHKHIERGGENERNQV